MSDSYGSLNGFEKKLLNGDRPCDVFNYYLFHTPFTIDDLLSVDMIDTYIGVKADHMVIVLDEPLHSFYDENLGLWGYANTDGEVVIAPQYTNAKRFCDGLSCVKLNDQYGFIDRQGEVVVEMKYTYCYDFSDGLACVELNGRYGFINKHGEVVVALKYKSCSRFEDGFARVLLGDMWGFINKDGDFLATK